MESWSDTWMKLQPICEFWSWIQIPRMPIMHLACRTHRKVIIRKPLTLWERLSACALLLRRLI